ncbi:MAG: IclR family transcriptional regulator [Chloroflexi bacterium]|nr:MAG: IclR family transcriptional regulator [Chloroflexota bacterium]
MTASRVSLAMLAAVRETPSGSLARGLSLLAIVAGSPRRGLGLSELAENAGFDKATTHRLARVLVRYGCLVQDEETRRYRLGVRVLDFGFAYLAGIDVRERALPFMQQLAREFGGSVSLAQLDGADIVYLERIPASQWMVSLEMRVGSRVPAHVTSMGKALLACLTDAQVRALLQGKKLQPLTARTITTTRQLLAQLAEIRSRGFAINDEETVIGLRSVAAAIRGHQGSSPTAAVNVAVPSAQYTLEQLASELGPRLAEVAEALSAELGGAGPRTLAT